MINIQTEIFVKQGFLSLLLFLSLFSSTTFAQQAARPAAAPTPPSEKTIQKRPDYAVPFVSKTLANGLEVIVLQDSSTPLVTVEVAVRTGSFTEPPELHGLSHLFEHMMFKPNFATILGACSQEAANVPPTLCRRADVFKQKIGDLSYLNNADRLSIFNGTTREEIVNYYYTTTRDYLDSAIHMLNDAIRYPAFDEDAFNEEKKNVIAEIDRHESNPFGLLDLTLKNKLFYKFPTRKDPLGTRESVGNATLEKMRTIQSRYYVPNNSALVVTGDVKPEEVFRLADQIMGSWERRPVDPFKEFPLAEHPPLPKNEAVFLERSADTMSEAGENVMISIGWHGPSIGKDDASTYAADVFSYIISQPDSKFQRALVDSGLASQVSLGYYTQRNVGPIQVLMVTSPDKAKAALAALYKQIGEFASPSYYSDYELDAAKTIVENNDLFEREKATDYTHTLGFWWSSTGIDYFRSYHAKLRATTRDDINRYLTTYIQGKNHVAIALATPSARDLAKLNDADLLGQ